MRVKSLSENMCTKIHINDYEHKGHAIPFKNSKVFRLTWISKRESIQSKNHKKLPLVKKLMSVEFSGNLNKLSKIYQLTFTGLEHEPWYSQWVAMVTLWLESIWVFHRNLWVTSVCCPEMILILLTWSVLRERIAPDTPDTPLHMWLNTS